MTALELGLRDRHGVNVKDKKGDIKLDRAACYMVAVAFLTAKTKPSLTDVRNDLAHGYSFDGLPHAGLLELLRDLIAYAYREMVAICAAANCG